MDDDALLDTVGQRLRAIRRDREITLTELATATGISVSTLSRLETGARRPTLELLLPLARVHGVQLDELVGAPLTGDPRVHLKPIRRNGMTMIPLTRRAGGVQAYKILIPQRRGRRTQQSHEGYEWMYVLDGRLALWLGDRDLELAPGEVVEFDTHVPHWFGAVDGRGVEALVLFGRQGERAHVRARDD